MADIPSLSPLSFDEGAFWARFRLRLVSRFIDAMILRNPHWSYDNAAWVDRYYKPAKKRADAKFSHANGAILTVDLPLLFGEVERQINRAIVNDELEAHKGGGAA